MAFNSSDIFKLIYKDIDILIESVLVYINNRFFFFKDRIKEINIVSL